MTERTSLLVSVDRVEGDIAVLLSREAHRWLLPREMLPEGTAEGDVLRVILEPEPEETERRRSRIRDLQQRLLDQSEEADGG